MMETINSIAAQAPTSEAVVLQHASSSPMKTTTNRVICQSSCASESPEVTAKKAQHPSNSFATPESNQRIVVTAVNGVSHSHTVNRTSNEQNTSSSTATSVTPSSVVADTSSNNNHGHGSEGTASVSVGSISSSPSTSSSSSVSLPLGTSSSASAQTSSRSLAVSARLNEPSPHGHGHSHDQITSKIQAASVPSLKSDLIASAGVKSESVPVPGPANVSTMRQPVGVTRTTTKNIVKSEPRIVSQSQSTTVSKAKVKVKHAHTMRTTTPVPTNGNGSRPQSHNFKIKTPVRSPVPKNGSSTFQGFNAEFPSFGSPSIFLSPYMPSTPSAIDKKLPMDIGIGNSSSNITGTGCGQEIKTTLGGITPTNFAADFGKNDMHDDALNNVLPWLSPNAYGLFSPEGGLTASITPSAISKPAMGAMGASNKFALPFDSNKSDAASGGIMMCVSPLARKNKTATSHKSKHHDTPINFNEVFASPRGDDRNKVQTVISNEIPTISDSSDKEAKMVLEKHLAERDVMEDEDLNVLLKLAETTPRRNSDGKSNAGTRVFRGAGGTFAYPAAQPPGPPSFLHLPIIGKSTGTRKGKISTKASSDGGTLKNGTLSLKDRKNARPVRPKEANHSNPTHMAGMHAHRPPAAYYPPPPYMHPAAATPGMGPYAYPYHGSGHPPPPPYMYPNAPITSSTKTVKGMKKKLGVAKHTKTSTTSGMKRPISTTAASSKRSKKVTSRGRGPGKKRASPGSVLNADKQKTAAAISAINSASGKKNDKAASLASAVLRGVTMRPSGKWQAQLYFAGKSRYIGVFDSREKAALAYEIAREHLQNKSVSAGKDTDAHVNAARKAAFEGVNETDPRLASS